MAAIEVANHAESEEAGKRTNRIKNVDSIIENVDEIVEKDGGRISAVFKALKTVSEDDPVDKIIFERISDTKDRGFTRKQYKTGANMNKFI